MRDTSDEVHAMSWTFNGLPIHALLVHFVVIVVPLAALCAVLGAVWPGARRRLGLVTPIIALAALVSVPFATQAGQALQEQIPETSLSEQHGEMGEGLLPWVAALSVVTVLQWVWFRFFASGRASTTPAMSVLAQAVIVIVIAALVFVAAAGSVVEVFLIGESGAKAVWNSRLH